MSIVTREQIMTALFKLVSGATWIQGSSTVPCFKLTSRRLQLWNTVTPAQRPALFMAEHEEHQTHDKPEIPMPLRELDVELFIYIDSTNLKSPISVLNNLMDAIEKALQPDNWITMSLTLGGLVSHCWIEGKVLKDPGDLDNDGLMMVPIHIVVP